MNVDVSSADPLAVETDLLCWMVTEESTGVSGLGEDHALAPAVRQSLGDLRGRFAKTTAVANPGGSPPRMLIAGLGPGSKITADTIRHVAGAISKRAQELGVARFAVVCPDVSGVDPGDAAGQITEGCSLALYDFDAYRSKKAEAEPDLTVVCGADVAGAVARAGAVSDGVRFARDVANMPPNECPPAGLADVARGMADEKRIKCTVLSAAQLSEGGFGGIMAVGKGSDNPPRLIVMEYGGGEGPPVALVGKAVTFDTGGISLKPGEKMDEMKFDKCGGCTVLGIMRAAAEVGLPLNIVGVIPSVENMPGGGSYRPGDIVRLYGGKTAEILNTDAEGRLILADALSYVEERFSPRCIIDFATLTGACIVALGCNVAGMVSDSDDMAASVLLSADRTAERVWRLPLDEDYMDMIKSKVADIKNLGTGRAAGTIAAAAFLKSAIKDTPWLHLDIAGTAWMQPASKKRPYNPPGATGFGVRLILDYLGRIAPGR
ncbi:MAG: leucyl aminopeptidase [Nitrosopumilaceae archaeon]|nr:leucyl aminopeptidase [Nitrosopumilaceae archaeon]